MRGRRLPFLLLLVAVVLLPPAGTGGGTETGAISRLTADPQGWALHPVIAAGADGILYAAWAQHLRPEKAEYVGIYVQRSGPAGWTSLGGRIGHQPGESGAQWPEGHAPALALVGGTPYVAWYEAGGYGWGKDADSAVFVSHWQGERWVLDRSDASGSGALNTAPQRAAREPVLAVIGGVLHAAWIETVSVEGSGTHNVVAVKRLVGGRWTEAGRPFRAADGGDSRIMALALTGVAGAPVVAWSELPLGSPGGRGVVHVARLDATEWKRIGRPLNASTDGTANFVATAVVGDTLHVAWQERVRGGPSQIHVKTWQGGSWTSSAGSLNADPLREAGRPALGSDGSRLWLAWTEGSGGERAKLYVRALSPGGGSAQGPLNADLREGAADTPGLAPVSGGIALIWAEKRLPPETKQVHVRVLR